MPVNIGNNNKIKNSTIAENVLDSNQKTKRTFYEKHPVICSLLISIFAGLLLLFSFWGNIISWVEGGF